MIAPAANASSFTVAGFAGLPLAAERRGDPDAPCVLLLHGAGQDRHYWRETAAALADAGRCTIALDLRGHGDSRTNGDACLDIDAYVADLRAVLAALPSRPVIVAASFGGWVAACTLGEADAAQLATGLVLLNAMPEIEPARMGEATAAFKARVATAGRDWDSRFLDSIDPVGMTARLQAAATRLNVPTLVIRGSDNPHVSATGTAMFAQRIRDAEQAEISGVGHWVTTDRVEAFNAVLLDFLERRVPLHPAEYISGSDARTLRDALGCFGTGVAVVTCVDPEGHPRGLTANSFTSVSLDPPLLLACIGRGNASCAAFEAAEHFAVNVLHIGQQPTSARFASRNVDRFGETAWEQWQSNAPIVSGSLAAFECARHAVVDGGDHIILVGRVLRAKYEPRRDPLIYFRGKYRRLHFC